MFKKSKIVVSVLLASVLILGSSISVFASNSTVVVPERSQQQHVSSTFIESEDSVVEPYGIKKWIATSVMKAVAKVLRSGGKLVDDIIASLGGKEARYFAQHTDTIADALDDLIKRGDVVEDAIIDTVSTALIAAGVPSGTARTIAAVFAFLAF